MRTQERSTRAGVIRQLNLPGSSLYVKKVLTMSIANIKEVVREKYGEAALRVQSGASSNCCSAPGLESSCDLITSNLYNAAQEDELPDTAIKASLGCGNPTALAELKPGETGTRSWLRRRH